jgi:hypothetical protein
MTYKVGDIVRYSTKFLQCVGWRTGVPKNGIIESVELFTTTCKDERQVCSVKWCDGKTGSILNVNLERSR